MSERDRQNIGAIALQGLGQFTSWRDRNPLRYDGVKLLDTRTEILANPRNAQLFDELLSAIAGEQGEEVIERFARYKVGAGTKEDMDFVTYATKEFSRSMKFAEEATKQITPEQIELFARRNGDIENMLVQDRARAEAIIKNSIFHAAMRTPEHVSSLSHNLHDLKENQKSGLFQRWNAKVNDLCTAVGTEDVKNFDVMYKMNKGERAETRVRVREHVRAHMNTFEKSLDLVASGLGVSKTDRLIRKADWVTRMKQERWTIPTSWSVSAVDENLKNIANFLGTTVGNDEIRGVVQKEVMENKDFIPASEQVMSFQEMRQETKPESIKTVIKQKISSDPQWKTRDRSYQDQKLGEWQREEVCKRPGPGFWTKLFQFLFKSEFNKTASEMLGRPVHV